MLQCHEKLPGTSSNVSIYIFKYLINIALRDPHYIWLDIYIRMKVTIKTFINTRVTIYVPRTCCQHIACNNNYFLPLQNCWLEVITMPAAVNILDWNISQKLHVVCICPWVFVEIEHAGFVWTVLVNATNKKVNYRIAIRKQTTISTPIDCCDLTNNWINKLNMNLWQRMATCQLHNVHRFKSNSPWFPKKQHKCIFTFFIS